MKMKKEPKGDEYESNLEVQYMSIKDNQGDEMKRQGLQAMLSLPCPLQLSNVFIA